MAIWPDRAQYRPGEPVQLLAEVTGPEGARGELRVRLTSGVAAVGELAEPVALGGGTTRLTLRWQPPANEAGLGPAGPEPGCGGRAPTSYQAWAAYGADAELWADGAPVAAAGTAFDVAAHWSVAPRYGFLADFAPGLTAETDASRLDAMNRLHLNVIQFYDWMYTHYDYVPPTEVFTDVLGRTVDFGAVRRRIDLCRRRGMAPLAYAAVYGAEEPFAEAHPDWLLYDGTGRPMSLGGVFFIQDPSPGSGWREYLLAAYRQALDLGFAGTHCDTYGSPHAGLTRDGRLVRLDEVLPGLMADAQALAEAADPAEGGAMLNNVKAWPLEAMAQAPGAALYIEVWPPDETYRDLHELILRVRRLDQRRQPILAAYLRPFHREAERPAGSMAGLRLASATIFASGGFHLLPGEGQGILAEAYYPRYGRLDERDWAVVQAYWDFQTRYGPWLQDPAAVDMTSVNTCGGAIEARFAGPAPFSARGLPGTIWTILKEGQGYRTVHLLNLTAVQTPHWNGPQPEAPELGPVQVRLEALRAPRTVWWASPDYGGGRPQAADWRLVSDAEAGQVLVATVPALHYWSMLVVEE